MDVKTIVSVLSLIFAAFVIYKFVSVAILLFGKKGLHKKNEKKEIIVRKEIEELLFENEKSLETYLESFKNKKLKSVSYIIANFIEEDIVQNNIHKTDGGLVLEFENDILFNWLFHEDSKGIEFGLLKGNAKESLLDKNEMLNCVEMNNNNSWKNCIGKRIESIDCKTAKTVEGLYFITDFKISFSNNCVLFAKLSEEISDQEIQQENFQFPFGLEMIYLKFGKPFNRSL